MKTFYPLPFDCYRCEPMPSKADKCNTCPRWAKHPKQTWGERTPVMSHDPKTCGMSGETQHAILPMKNYIEHKDYDD